MKIKNAETGYEMRNVDIKIESWPLKESVSITGYTFESLEVLVVLIEENGVVGRGEGCGVYYLGETCQSILEQAQRVKDKIEQGAGREELLRLLPHGGARNAVDCALWDLEAKLSGKNIMEIVGLAERETYTVTTIGIGTPNDMAEKARRISSRFIKVKLDGEQVLERLKAVREARPDAKIVIDANQGWSIEQLESLMADLVALEIEMIEQPLPRGRDADLQSFSSPINLCADESCLFSGELNEIAGRYHMVNIKLDKAGGLTEALIIAKKAKELGLKLMVGNMFGTSLSMAPSYVLAQLCDIVDLDGPLFLESDREFGLAYENGIVSGLTPKLWG